MKLSLSFPEFWAGLSQYALDEWHRFFGVLQDWTNAEHKDDGTHGDITADTITSEDTRLNVGLNDGTSSQPSLYFNSHSESAQGTIRGATAWPGWYNRSSDYPAQWAYASTDTSGLPIGALFTISALGIVPVYAGLTLGNGTSGTIADEERWGSIYGEIIDAEKQVSRTQVIAANGVNNTTTTGTQAALDLDVDDACVHTFSPGGGALTIQGILQPTDGRYAIHYCHVLTGGTVTIKHNDGAASAAHKIQTPSLGDEVFGQYDSWVMFHTGTDWRILSFGR